MALFTAAQLIDWTPGTHTGVIGGIPTDRTTFIDVTDAPYSADNTGATDASAAIQAAVDAAILIGSLCHGVYIPPGTYRIEAGISLGSGFSGKTLKGAGADQTELLDYAGTVIGAGSASGSTTFGESLADRTVTDGLTKGSTTITIAGSTANYTVDRIVVIGFENDNSYPHFGVNLYNVWDEQPIVTQAVRVVSKTSNTITFFPPLFEDHAGTAVIRALTFQASRIGIESLKISGTEGVLMLRAIHLANCVESWIYDVEVIQANNYGLFLENCFMCEVRKAFVHDGKLTGSNGAGMLCGMWSSLVIDSIFVETFPMWEVNGSSGNAFLYNFTGSNGQTNNNHGPFCRFNLYEGNAIGFMMSDGYFGGASQEIHHRNYYYSTEFSGVNLRRGCRDFVFVGNVVGVGPLGLDGLPNIGNGDFDGTTNTLAADPWKDWQMTGTLTTRTDDDSGEITLDSGDLYYDVATPHFFQIYWGTPPSDHLGCVVDGYNAGTKVVSFHLGSGVLPAEDTELLIGPGSFFNGTAAQSTFQEKDLAVAASTVDKGNYIIDLDSFSSLGGDAQEDSLVFESAPDFFISASKSFPPFNAEAPEGALVTNIPAADRYYSGLPPEPPVITENPTINGSGLTGQPLTAVTGEVTGNPPPTITWQWQVDDGGAADITGATEISFIPGDDEVGLPVRVEQTATSGGDTDVAYSDWITITPFMGDIHTLVKDTTPGNYTTLWRRAAKATPTVIEEVVVDTEDTFPPDFENDYDYLPVNGSGDRWMTGEDGPWTLEEMQAHRDATDPL